MNVKKYNVIGIMSGTSCDGLDLALTSFWYSKNKWNYELINNSEVIYTTKLRNKLLRCSELNAYDLKKLDIELGKFISDKTSKLINTSNEKVDLISSHGHTVFHEPKEKINYQIGNPFEIYNNIKIPLVYNFREFDVILGGQGAPLVPYGEKKLFRDFNFCVNLGGIINISSLNNKNLFGYDVCPGNIILNSLARKLNYEFDLDGGLSKKGEYNENLFDELNKLEYYNKNFPKSLDLLYIKKHYLPVFKNIKVEDSLKTFINHIAYQLNKSIKEKNNTVLLTGGGALNKHLLEKINYYNKLDVNFIVPNKKLIIFKEAIVFGFLGLLRYLNKKNIDKSVTGSSSSSSSGLIVDNKLF